jgi:hypothetical protein
VTKFGLLLATLGFVGEGLFELPRLGRAFTRPPSVPGESKIVEHFAIQHLVFPLLGSLLVFRPASLRRLFDSRLSRGFFAGLSLALIIPETIVSFRPGGDLFRPYRFDLRSHLLRTLESLALGSHHLNLLQALHLLLNHWLFSAVLTAVCLRPSLLDQFVGPHSLGSSRSKGRGTSV